MKYNDYFAGYLNKKYFYILYVKLTAGMTAITNVDHNWDDLKKNQHFFEILGINALLWQCIQK